MSKLQVDNIVNKADNGSPTLSKGAIVTGVCTATTFNGNISGTTGSFTGNVSVGGTLTYEDVTNIDSVGLITARTGIKVLSGGINAVGVVTATSFSGDGSNLSGIQAGVANFVASGTIPGGVTVVINTDGTVGIITTTPSNIPTVSDPVVFESAAIFSFSGVYDSSNEKVVITYKDSGNNSYGTAIVGTVSGTSISFGTPVVFESSNVSFTSATFDSTNNRVVIAYANNGNNAYGTAIVGTVSGTSISFGTPVVFESADTDEIFAVYDSSNEKVVIVYQDAGNSNYGTAIVGTVSGTSISFGSAVVFNSAATYHYAATYDSTNNKVVIAYRDSGNSEYGTAIVGTVSGTSISFGSETVFEYAIANEISATFDSTNSKVVIVYQDAGNSNYGTAIVGTVSGTSISFGSAVEFNSASTTSCSAVYDSASGKVVIAYRDNGNNLYGTVIIGTVSGTSISFGTPVVFESAECDNITTIFNSSQKKIVVAYRDVINSNFGTAVVVDPTTTNLTSDNYIGISAEAIADGATGSITIVGGINTLQTGLTTATKLFVQRDGTLSTIAGTPSVVAGISISASKILIK